jgi:murein DD-endopeptidase MepM/ murein hydrolase activator NlpD
MSIVWANNLKSKTDIHAGKVLRIPPVTGLIVRVTATDTLEAIAARYDVNGTDIIATNGLDDATLINGQVLVIPGAKGAAIPAKPGTKSPVRTSGGSAKLPSTYHGGKFLWPVVGGGNYISQYFHYGHYAIDIAADYGSTVRAAAAGTVTFAGWKNNGGGYQVWIAHGSGLYTTYNHMSAITVGIGQHVARGTQVGRIGMTGDATGPHCHFEVWRGPVWNGGTRVNPLAYF